MDENLRRTLNAASGYLDLGMPEDAVELLDSVPAECRDHPAVMGCRVEISFASGQWDEAAGIAKGLVERNGEEPQHWIWWAYATRRADSIAAAEMILVDALARHPDVAMIHFNLACYAAVEGRTEEAGKRLSEAMRLDKNLSVLADDDPDLESLR